MKLNISESELDAVFHALAHPARRRLMRHMAERGEARVTELAEEFDVSLNQVSKHLKILEGAGLMRRRREGREHLCSPDLRALMQARSWMDAYAGFWGEALDGLGTWLDETESPRTANAQTADAETVNPDTANPRKETP